MSESLVSINFHSVSALASFFSSLSPAQKISSISIVRSASQLHVSLSTSLEIPIPSSTCPPEKTKTLVSSHVATMYSDEGLSVSFYAALFTLFSKARVEIMHLRRLCSSKGSIIRACDIQVDLSGTNVSELRGEIFALSSQFKTVFPIFHL
jgi:hypothetical protein